MRPGSRGPERLSEIVIEVLVAHEFADDPASHVGVIQFHQGFDKHMYALLGSQLSHKDQLERPLRLGQT